MLSRQQKAFVIILSVLFVFLFHKQPIGLNLLIYEILVVSWLHFSQRISFGKTNLVTVYAGLLVSALAVVLSHSTFAVFINICTFVLFIGMILAPELRSFPYALLIAGHNLVKAPVLYFTSAGQKQRKGLTHYLWRFRIFVIPVGIIALFITFYAGSNPIFNDLTVSIGDRISNALEFVFSKIDGWIILTWLLGLLVAMFVTVRYVNRYFLEKDQTAPDNLLRKRKKVVGKLNPLSLKNELRAAIFLLSALNLVILVLNAIDIYWVWFNFEWNGSFLKQFVHEGTYLLILSILVSMVIVLYFFRGNLNHFKQNRWLKILSYAWLAQNAILVVSVAIRNFWYIHYFSLAYRRIGVIVFLLLTLYGIYTVIVKVKSRKTDFYLVKSNAYALFVVMVLCTVPNWDVMIAKYNFRNYDRSFVHLEFLAGLSDKALPYLDKNPEELSSIQTYQDDMFSFKRKGYMTAESYHETIQRRKARFISEWENKGILSWNLPEYLAYRKLKE